MSEMITSSSNPIIKEIKSLNRKKDRWKKKKYYIEGVRAVKESINSNSNLEYLVYSDMLFSAKGGKELFKEISSKNYKLSYVSDKLFYEISDTETPQGILSVIKFDIKKLNNALKNKRNFFILLDRVQDPGNMGTIIRTADAFGANGVIVTDGCVDVFNPKTIRSTMGSIFHVPLIYYKSSEEAMIELRDNNIKIVSTALNAKNYCFDIDFNMDFVLVIGNEASGVSNSILEASDMLIKIPMLGKAESLNAAVASSVIMYEVLRQRIIV